MTPREELIQAIQTSPDDVVSALLETLENLRGQSVTATESTGETPMTEKVYRKNGILVAETGRLSDFDIVAFIKEMREERIQSQIDKMGL